MFFLVNSKSLSNFAARNARMNSVVVSCLHNNNKNKIEQ